MVHHLVLRRCDPIGQHQAYVNDMTATRTAISHPESSLILSGYELARKEIIPLHVLHALLFISLPSLPDYYVNLPIFTCSGGCLRHEKGIVFLFLKSFRMQLQINVKKSPTRTFYNKY